MAKPHPEKYVHENLSRSWGLRNRQDEIFAGKVHNSAESIREEVGRKLFFSQEELLGKLGRLNSIQMEKHCLCLDLKDDPKLIEIYKQYHAPGNAWPEIMESIRSAGIENMEIYLAGNRMFMIMVVNEHFDREKKAKADATNEKVQEWEELMWKFQQALPFAKPGEKWVQMERIFSLKEQ